MYRRQSTFGRNLDLAGLNKDIITELTAIERAFNEIRQTQTPQIIQSFTGTTGGGGGSGSGGSITVQDHTGATFIPNVTTLRVNTTYGLTVTNSGGGSAEINLSQNLTATGSPTFANLVVSTQLTIDTLSGVLKATAGVVSGSSTTSDLPEGTNLYYTDERVDDRVGALVIGGTGITATYADPAGTLTLALDFTEFDTDDITEGSTNYYASQIHVMGRIGEVMEEPTGFPPTAETDISFSFDNGTRTLTVSPTGVNYVFWLKGIKYTISTPKTCVIADTEGIHYVYFDTDGLLYETTDFGAALLTDYAILCGVQWDAANNLYNLILTETHGFKMDGATQAYIHLTIGGKWLSGFGLSNFTIGDGSLDSHAQFSYDLGSYIDDDIIHSYTASANPAVIKMFYKIGAGLWRARKTPNGFAMIEAGSSADYAGTNRPAYNLLTGSTWSLEEPTDQNYILTHIFACNDHTEKLVGIVGENQYNTLALARDGANSELAALRTSGLPINEWIPIATVIFQCRTSYTNSVNARIVTNDLGTNWVDWRTSSVSPSVFTSTDHGILTGLGDDDHTQYVHISTARTISAVHTFNPGSATAAFVLHANAQNQLIAGLYAAKSDILATTRAIQVSGAVAGTANFDGSAAINISTTLTGHKASHEDTGSDEISVTGLSGLLADAQKVVIHKNGTAVGTRKNVNFIEGSNITLTIADDAGDDEVDVTIASAAGGSVGGSDTHVQFNDGGSFGGDAGLVYDKTTNILTISDALKIGSTVASAGVIRLANNTAIAWRNSEDNADVTLTVTAAEVATFSGAVNAASLTLGTDLAIAEGGTGGSTRQAATVNILPSMAGKGTTYYLRINAATDDAEWATVTASASAGGSDTQFQFNDGGTTIGGSSGWGWTKATGLATYNVVAGPGIAIHTGSLLMNQVDLTTSAVYKILLKASVANDLVRFENTDAYPALVCTSNSTSAAVKTLIVRNSSGETATFKADGGLAISGALTMGSALAVAQGGTGQTTEQAARVALLPSMSGLSTSYYLRVKSGLADVEWAILSGVPAAGSDTQVMFNDGGSFAGDAQLVWNKTTNVLTVTGTITVTGTAPQITMSNATSNWIDMSTGYGDPKEYGTSTAGLKLKLQGVPYAGYCDYSIGAGWGYMWFTVAAGDAFFRWYGGSQANGSGVTTPAMELDAEGYLLINGKNKTTTALLNVKNTDAVQVFIARGDGYFGSLGGANSGVTFKDRSGAEQWQFYGTSSICRLWNGSADIVEISNAGAMALDSTLTATAAIVGGANPAAAGAVRIPNNVAIGFRNAANSADYTFKLNTGNQFEAESTGFWMKSSVAWIGTSQGSIAASGLYVKGAANTRVYIEAGSGNAEINLVQGTNTWAIYSGAGSMFTYNASGVRQEFQSTGDFLAYRGLLAGGDPGSGVSSYTTFTDASSAGNSGATFTVKGVSGATARNSDGFIKIYIGTTAAYLPYWTAITG